uniref:Centrosomal protein of n=1 Tax=Schistocephalus solidus TaxID=70667 RepID=A0A0X3Q3S8_SCHSO
MISDFKLVGVSAPRSAKSDRSLPHSRLNSSRSIRSSNEDKDTLIVRAARMRNAKPQKEAPRNKNDSLEILLNSSSSINAENVSYYSSLSRNDSATGWDDETADWNNIEIASVDCDSRGDHAGIGCRVTPIEKLENLSDRSSPHNSFGADGTPLSDRKSRHTKPKQVGAERSPRGQEHFHPRASSGDENLEEYERSQQSATSKELPALTEISAARRLQRWWRRHLSRQRTEAAMLERLLAEEKRRIAARVSSLASTPRSAGNLLERRTPRLTSEIPRRSCNINYDVPCETVTRPTTKNLSPQQENGIYARDLYTKNPAENTVHQSRLDQCGPTSMMFPELDCRAGDSEIQVSTEKRETSPTQTAWKAQIEERRSTLMTNILSDLDSLKREPQPVQAAEPSSHGFDLGTGLEPADKKHCRKRTGQQATRNPVKLEEFLVPSSRLVSESVDFAVTTKSRSGNHRKSSASFHQREISLYALDSVNSQSPNRSYDPTSKTVEPDAIHAEQTEILRKPRIKRTPSVLTPRQLCISNLFNLETRWNTGDTQCDHFIQDLEDPVCERHRNLTQDMDTDALTAKEEDEKHPRSRSPQDAKITYEELAAALSKEKVKTAKLEEFVTKQYDSLQQQRDLSMQQLHDAERTYEERIAAQKDDYEATLNKNYKLIDELIAEKQALTEQCSKLVDDMRLLKEKAEAKQKQLEDNHKCEIQKLQGKFVAAEKLRRERWEASKIKSIKELTIKGVEKEIARLVASHKEELEELRKDCMCQVQAADARAFQAYGRQLDELRLALTQEKEEACAKERRLANERFENLVEDERESLAKLRKRLLAENADERERMVATSARQREEFRVRTEQLESEIQKMSETHREEMEQLKNNLENKHASQIEELKTRSNAEREVWEQKFRSTLELEFATREREIAEKLRKDRDKQLEMVIRNLEAEATAAQEEAEKVTNGKLKVLKERHQQEINELEQSERQITEKYNQLRTRCLEHEGEIECLTVRLNQRETELKEVQALYEKLKAERDHVSDVVRQEFADRIVASEEEVKTLRVTLAETRSKLALEVDKRERDIQRAKESMASELEQVHERVKDAVRQKEINIGALKKEHNKEIEELKFELQLSRQRSEHLEKLLDQQRKQLLQLKPHSVHRK